MKTQRRQRRALPEASLSFLDVISCGFGAVVLLLVIARTGDPALKGEDQLLDSVASLQQRLFAIRGESASVSQQLKSRQQQLSKLEERVARLREKLASIDRQSQQNAPSQAREKERLQLALQVLSEEMRRLAPTSALDDQLIGGIPVDSDYIIFVIDSSGSMQSGAWVRVKQEMLNILDIYPQVEGIQVLNDMGNYMFANYRGRWLADTPEMRQQIINRLDSWAPFSNSSPVEGIKAAIKTFYRPGRRISLYILGDDFQGSSIGRLVKAVDQLNGGRSGVGGSNERLVRIHAIGFPVNLPPGGTPSSSAIRFAALMRELSYQNGGTFIGLNSLRP